MEIKEYTPEYREQWDDFVRSAKNSLFMHYRDYMDYHADRFKDNSLLFFDKGTLLALLPANLHDDILYSHGGLTFGGIISGYQMKLVQMLACFEVIKQYLFDKNISSLIYKSIPYIYHSLCSDEDIYALFRNNARLLKVEPTTTIYLQNMVKISKGRSAQISRAKKKGVITAESSDFDNFVDLLNLILTEKHGTKAAHTAKELELLKTKFPQNIKLFIAKYQDELIAGTVVFEYANIVHTQYMVANQIAREFGGLDYIIDTLIKMYAGSKQYFDFGISTTDAGMVINDGLVLQKETFGGRTTVHQTWLLTK
jgi:hypothetical protein